MAQQLETHALQRDTVEDMCGRTVEQIEALGGQIASGMCLEEDTESGFVRIHTLLAALPLTTDEFGLATNRLRNAGQYLHSEERGAALYELKSLARSLAHDLHAIAYR